MKSLKSIWDVVATLVAMLYFVCFFFVGYWLVYARALWPKSKRAFGFQRASHHYVRGLWWLFKRLAPGLRLDIQDRDRIASIKSSIIICNHLSFLDPLLIVALIPQAVTVVNLSHMRIPLFGWMLRQSGYAGSSISGPQDFWSDRMEGRMRRALEAGGNVFVFPEGTRSRTGRLNRFKKGAFFFAKNLDAPIEMLYVSGTGSFFPPGRFLIDTHPARPVRLERLGRIDRERVRSESLADLKELAYDQYRQRSGE